MILFHKQIIPPTPLNCKYFSNYNLYIQKEKNGRSFEKLLPFKKSIKII